MYIYNPLRDTVRIHGAKAARGVCMLGRAKEQDGLRKRRTGVFQFILFYEAEASLQMATWTALMPCCFWIKTKAYAQTPIFPPTGTERIRMYQVRSPKDLSWNQVDSESSLMTQLIERTVQKVPMLGKVANALKDSFRIQNGLDELNKQP